MKRCTIVYLVLVTAVVSGAWAQARQADLPALSPPSMRVLRTDDFTIDGRGASPAWSKAEWQMLAPRAGGQAPHATRVKMLYSPTGLYVLSMTAAAPRAGTGPRFAAPSTSLNDSARWCSSNARLPRG